jgi:mono/diheme cytochrome c family protein/cbb3-type cytochrome oxidase subunit 1
MSESKSSLSIQHSALSTLPLMRAHTSAALAAFVCSWLLDILASVQLSESAFLANRPWLSTGRVWNAYSHGFLFGWLGNAFFAFLYFAVPRLTGRRVTSRGLGWLLWLTWNFGVVIPEWVALQTGVELQFAWGDASLVNGAVTTLTLALACFQFVTPLFRAGMAKASLPGWYILAGLLLTLVAAALDLAGSQGLSATQGHSFADLCWQDAVGLFATPLVLAIAYFVLPAATGRPIARPILATIAFCVYFIAYPFSRSGGVGWAHICVAAAMLMNVFVIGRSIDGHNRRDVPLRFVQVSAISIFMVALLDALLFFTFSGRELRFTDFVSARSQLWWLGFASFAVIGGLLHVRQGMAGLRYQPRIATAAFMLMGLGLLVLVIDLEMAGMVVQGRDSYSYTESVRASRPFWIVRTVSEGVILVGFLALILSTVIGPRGFDAPAAGDSPGGPWLARAALPGFAIAICFVLMLLPVIRQDKASQREGAVATPAIVPPLAENELRGRAIYVREGCVNCHSQIVRPTEFDERHFGVRTQPWELAADPPPVSGSHRVGPDLARERGRKTRDWHLAHLWNPRWVAPDSNMPRYPWLFSGDVTRPTSEALDLIAYLESLGRAVALVGLTVPPSPPLKIEPTVLSERDALRNRGADVFAHNCSGCHGSEGEGDGPAAAHLLPKPRTLATAFFSPAALNDVFSKGRTGSAMPSWRDLPPDDLRAVATFVRSLGPAPDLDINAVDDAGFPPPGKGQPVHQSSVGLSESEAKKARGLYQLNCQTCHGPEGEGNPIAASTVPPAPTSFRRIRPTEAYAIDAITNGVPGTAMTPWRENLSEEDRLLLARYLRSLYAGD